MKTIFRLLGFVQRHWFLLLLAFVCIVLTTGFAIVIPRMLGDGIDTVLGMGKRSFVVVVALVVIGASTLRGLTGYGQRYFAEVAAQKITYNVRNALYERLQRLSFSFHDQNQTGRIRVPKVAARKATGMTKASVISPSCQFIVSSM